MTRPRLALLSLIFLCVHSIAQQAPADPVTPALDLTPDASGSLSRAQMQVLFRVVAEKDIENDKRQRDYTYIERQVQNSVNGRGKIKSSEVNTYEVLEIYGEHVERLIEKNDKPLSQKDAAKEEQKIQKIIGRRTAKRPTTI
jgi:hypothetical protein